ncbi:hypothetical protein [Marimonas lutisalis]|uniref:hypothetical protein n=1 Tax=Marimonas lutisalis TaxID=2545756 RepID=UPI00187656D2|nr:hypothetical protein [Marimonas lutisalis]
MKNAGLIGASLVVSYTFFIAAADGLTKKLTTLVAAPQMYAISGAVMVGLCITTAYGTSKWQSLRTTCKFAMALRSAATISAALLFFQSFRLLPFADVFIFIGMMPLLAGLMAAPVLGERVSPASWAAVSLGLIGAWCLFPAGLDSATAGHALAMLAALAGTFSIVLSRYISRHGNNSLAQVFYPNL